VPLLPSQRATESPLSAHQPSSVTSCATANGWLARNEAADNAGVHGWVLINLIL
jgi:hypothetical protein